MDLKDGTIVLSTVSTGPNVADVVEGACSNGGHPATLAKSVARQMLLGLACL